MRFQAAYSYMKNGHALALPEWGGYWEWDSNAQTILIRTRKGESLDIRETDNLDYTMSFIFRDDWYIVGDVSSTEHYENKESN